MRGPEWVNTGPRVQISHFSFRRVRTLFRERSSVGKAIPFCLAHSAFYDALCTNPGTARQRRGSPRVSPSARSSVLSMSAWPGLRIFAGQRHRPTLFELIRDLVDAGLGAAFVAGLVVAAHANPADRVVADPDRIAATERDDFSQLPLAEIFLAGLAGIAPFRCRAAERARRICFAPREFETMRGRIIRRDEQPHPAGAIDHGNRNNDVACRARLDRPLGDFKRQFPSDVALRLHLSLRCARQHARRYEAGGYSHSD